MKPNDNFVADFEASHLYVDKVAAWLVSLGYHVLVPEPKLRPDASVRADYSDSGDLVVTNRWGVSKTVEVKHRSVEFTGPDDYPFDTVFVNEKYKLTPEHLARVWSYVILDRTAEHAVVVFPETRDSWVEVNKHDEAQHRDCTFLACPVKLARFFTLPTP